MSVCPNINLSEWKALEERFGRYQAYRDFVQSGYKIRTVEEVQAKLNEESDAMMNTARLPHTKGIMSGSVEEVNMIVFNSSEIDTDSVVKQMVQDAQTTRAMEIARKLSDNLGVPFNIISAERAREITAGTVNPWSGQAALYHGGTAYFVGDSLSLNNVLHEFAHPLVRQIQVDNPTLFNNLYDKVANTPEGRKIIQDLQTTHPNLVPGDMMYAEEIVVKALELAAMKQQNSSAFMNAIRDILFAIKKILRNALGQIDVSKLDQNTTLDQLAYMLTNDKFQINTELITEEDVVAYAQSFQQEINELKNLDKKKMQDVIRDGYKIASRQLRQLQEDKNYRQLALVLRDQYKRPDMETIMGDLGKYQKDIDNIVNSVVEEMELLQNQSTALVNTVYNVQTVISKIEAHMKDIYRNQDSQENLQKAVYYQKIIKYWEAFIIDLESSLRDPEAGVPSNAKIFDSINKTRGYFNSINELTNTMMANGARDTLYAEFEPITRDVKERYEHIISELKKKGAPQKTIDKWHREYHGLNESDYSRYKTLNDKYNKGEYMSKSEKLDYANLRLEAANGLELTKEKMEDLLKNNVKDANWLNSFMEGYMYNNDPVIGGLALYVKNRMNEVMINAQAKMNAFHMDISEDLKELGYNPHNIGDLGKRLMFLDTVAKEEDGKLVPKKIWTFLNPFKDYRHDLRVINRKVSDAEEAYAESGSVEAIDNLYNAIIERKAFMRKYFHQEFVPEFYEREKVFDKFPNDTIGAIAQQRRNEVLDNIRKAGIELDESDSVKELDLLWREYRQIHSLYDQFGNPKQGTELLISERLREYRDNSREFFEWKKRSGVFQNLLHAYEDELATKYGVGSDEYNTLRDEWIRKNTRVVIKPEFFTQRQNILDRITEILKTLPDTSQKELDLAPYHQAILDIKNRYRDENGQPNAEEMTPESRARVKELEEEIERRKGLYMGVTGLNKMQTEALNKLLTKQKTEALTDLESAELNSLFREMMANRLSSIQKKELNHLYKQLNELSSNEPTEYYVDVVNNYLSTLNTTEFEKQTGQKIIDETSAHYLLDKNIVDELKTQSVEFSRWFDSNHISYETKDGTRYKRVSVWSVTRPTDPNHYKSTQIKDRTGKVTDIIQGKPVTKFYRQEVKAEYQNEKIVGKTVDNRGNFLPKGLESLDRTQPEWDKYINYKYFEFKENDPKAFKVLEKSIRYHLSNQTGLNSRDKLYLDFPRFTMGGYESLLSTNVSDKAAKTYNGLTQMTKRLKEFYKGSKDDAESGYNYNNEKNLVYLDAFDDETSSVPVAGLYDIDHENVSTDLISGLNRYMFGAAKQKKLIEIHPLAQAIQDIVNDPANGGGVVQQVKKNMISRFLMPPRKKKDETVRARAINNFIEREFEGVTMTGIGSESRILNNAANFLFKRASFQFFALNIPSALKNGFGAKFQTMIQAAAEEYINPISAAKGEAWSGKAMVDLSFGGNLYTKGPKSLLQQIVQIFDPAQGRLENDFRVSSMSRTITKDVVEGSWLYSPRKWLELQATLQLFGGMMYHQKVEQVQEDGTTKTINYIDAWELNENKQIVLKKGIDPKWGITYDDEGNIKMGSEFSSVRNRIHQVTNNLQGAYSEYDQPEAQRWVVFRFVSYLRRYFTPMVMNRFGFAGPLTNAKPRLNPGLGAPQMGYYIRTLQVLKDTASEFGKNLPYLQKDEKAAMMKVFAEVALLLLVGAIISLAFGWDPDDDDEERYKKLRKKSGALPWFGIEEDPSRQFNAAGWLELHALNLMIQIRAENEQFLPIPEKLLGFGGIDNYLELLDIKSIVAGPTTDTYQQMVDDAIAMWRGEDGAYYSRDVGPYSFQKKGGRKIDAKIAKMLGFTGSSMDPANAIQKFYQAMAMAKR